MVARIFAFQARKELQCDWTQSELAELYRIEHALVQSGLAVEHDRGLTDEGDPWFVFCRPDGEVLIHLARFDGLYRLHSPALSTPLVGRNFLELTKAFADQMPVQVVVNRRKGANLYVHPAAMLAVIIGTIFVAAQDVLPPVDPAESPKKTPDSNGEAVAAHPLKASLQASFQSYFDSIVTWLKDGSSIQHSIAANAINIVAAVLTGLTDAVSHELALKDDSGEAPAPDHAHSQLTVEHYASVSTSQALTLEADRSTAKLASLSSNSESSELPHVVPGGDGAQKVAALVQGPAAASIVTAASEDFGYTKALDSYDKAKAIEHLSLTTEVSTQDQNAHVLLSINLKAAPDALNAASVSQGSAANSAPTSSAAVNDLLTTLTTVANLNGAQSGYSEITNLLSHASSIDLTKSDWAFLLHSNISSPEQQGTGAGKPGNAVVPIATSFDAQAAATLENFLKSNPHVQAIYDEHSVIIYQSDSSAHSADSVLNVWSFADGSTITLVGSSDHHVTLT